MNIPSFEIDPVYAQKGLSAQLGIVAIETTVEPSSDTLQAFIHQQLNNTGLSSTEMIRQNPIIDATRKAYKLLGKDPSRYRPSAEALMRRIVQGKGLYQISNIVDTLNLISIQSGYSIGGYNLEKIEGNLITLSVGEKEDAYQAIGRGDLNIEGLPVLRDAVGAFGSPTSDSTRTMATNETQQFLMVFFGLGTSENLEDWLKKTAIYFQEQTQSKIMHQQALAF